MNWRGVLFLGWRYLARTASRRCSSSRPSPSSGCCPRASPSSSARWRNASVPGRGDAPVARSGRESARTGLQRPLLHEAGHRHPAVPRGRGGRESGLGRRSRSTRVFSAEVTASSGRRSITLISAGSGWARGATSSNWGNVSSGRASPRKTGSPGDAVISSPRPSSISRGCIR